MVCYIVYIHLTFIYMNLSRALAAKSQDRSNVLDAFFSPFPRQKSRQSDDLLGLDFVLSFLFGPLRCPRAPHILLLHNDNVEFRLRDFYPECYSHCHHNGHWPDNGYRPKRSCCEHCLKRRSADRRGTCCFYSPSWHLSDDAGSISVAVN